MTVVRSLKVRDGQTPASSVPPWEFFAPPAKESKGGR